MLQEYITFVLGIAGAVVADLVNDWLFFHFPTSLIHCNKKPRRTCRLRSLFLLRYLGKLQ